MKKATIRIIKEREAEARNDKFASTLTEYSIKWISAVSESVKAHGYVISCDGHLIFFLRLGDELMECARFRDWNSVVKCSKGND